MMLVDFLTYPRYGFHRSAMAPLTPVLRCRRLPTGRERCGAYRSQGFQSLRVSTSAFAYI